MVPEEQLKRIVEYIKVFNEEFDDTDKLSMLYVTGTIQKALAYMYRDDLPEVLESAIAQTIVNVIETFTTGKQKVRMVSDASQQVAYGNGFSTFLTTADESIFLGTLETLKRYRQLGVL